jgi:hypothetical protein|tara:strand:- start:1858 stop:2079 length:222 start_codon:yes stop_codon:yes gene_type:complete
MILNVIISCLSWGIIGGINKFNPLIKLRLNHAALIDLGELLGELFCHASLMELTQRAFLFSFSITNEQKENND